MKKLIVALIGASILFASSSLEDKKLDLILQKIEQLEKKLDEKDKKIEELQKEIINQRKEIQKKVQINMAIKSCKRIVASNLKYSYNGDVIPYYNLTYTLKNTYPKPIVYLVGNLLIKDKDGSILVEDYVKRKVNMPVNGTITVNKVHTIDSEIEKELKNENPSDIRLEFKVIKAEFADGTKVDCGGDFF